MPQRDRKGSSRSDSANCYDYPQYWDLAFRNETKLEADFFEQAFAHYAGRPLRRILEPGCGGGRLVVEMAARGYDVHGFDISDPAIRYLKRRLKRRGLAANVYVDDMTQFRLERPVDAVVNTFNTFRHLLDESAARSHLLSVADSLDEGGLFFLGLHVIPYDADDEDIERWTASHAGVRVTVTMRVLETDWRRRQERLRFNLRVRHGQRDLKLRTDYPLRLYRASQLAELINSIDAFELCDVFDFWYDLDEPLQLDEEISDTVLVLRKR